MSIIGQVFSVIVYTVTSLAPFDVRSLDDMQYKIKDYHTFRDKRFNIDVEYFNPKKRRWEDCQISLRNNGTSYYINGTLGKLVVTYTREKHNKWGNYLVEQVKNDSQIKDKLTKWML